MLSISLPPETESRLKGEASRRGLDAAEYARKLIEAGLSQPSVDQATLDLLAKWDREQATEDPDEITRRRQEVDQFKEAINRSRLAREGPGSRKVYP
jgi:predicted DNA-binding protein